MRALLQNWTLIHTVVGILIGGFVGFFASADQNKNNFWGFIIGGLIGGLLTYAGLLYCKCFPLLDLMQKVRQTF